PAPRYRVPERPLGVRLPAAFGPVPGAGHSAGRPRPSSHVSDIKKKGAPCRGRPSSARLLVRSLSGRTVRDGAPSRSRSGASRLRVAGIPDRRMQLEVPFPDEVRDLVFNRRTRIRRAVALDLIQVRTFRTGLCLTQRMLQRLLLAGHRVDQAHIAHRAAADFHYSIGLNIGACFIKDTRLRWLLLDACRLA